MRVYAEVRLCLAAGTATLFAPQNNNFLLLTIYCFDSVTYIF